MTTRRAGYRTAGAVWRGLGAAALLAGFVICTPVGLLAIGADPRQLIPDQWPQLAEIRQWPQQAWCALRWAYYDGSLIPTILLLVVWVAWLIFVWMVLAEITTQVRDGLATAAHRGFAATNPRGWICGLVTAFLVLISTGATSTPATTSTQPVAASHHNPPRPPVAVDLAAASGRISGPLAAKPAVPPAATEMVRPPTNGIHDSLWRIAERRLGDGARWPEIWALNKGTIQVDGRVFTNPNRIHPGWVLLLPEFAPLPPTPPAPNQTDSDDPGATPRSTPSQRPETTSSAPPSHVPPVGDDDQDQPSPAPMGENHEGAIVEWGPEIFVGLGLAAAVSAALLMARRRYRRNYRPGSGRRDDLPVAPAVHRLRLAHLRAAGEPDGDDVTAIGTPPPLLVGPVSAGVVGVGGLPPAAAAPELGVRDGREIALDLSGVRGLGLVGPGAVPAARALLVALLTRERASGRPAWASTSGEPLVIVPANDLATLLGIRLPDNSLPVGLRPVADLGAALGELEAEILRRTSHDDEQPDSGWPTLALVATLPGSSTRRLQAIVDNGAPLGIVGLLLGQWHPGVTAHVHADGTVSATNPGVGEALEGTRMYRLPDTDATDLLRLFRQAQPDNPTDQPARSDDAGVAPAPPHAETRPIAATDPLTSDRGGPSGGHAEDSTPDSGDTELEITRPNPLPAPTPAVDSDSRTAGMASVPASGPLDRDPSDDEHVTPVAISLLGPLQIRWRPDVGASPDTTHDITAAFPPRQRELLVYLTLHPDGVHRDALAATLWADNPPDRPTNALNTALSRLRRAVSTATDGALSDITILREARYQLDPTLADVDYWHFAAAVAARRAASSDTERTAALRRVVDRYTGRLADGTDTEWIDAIREATARDAIDAVAALARAMVDTDPEYTLNLLETARAFDPHNELLYRDIMRLQERLGQLDAIPRTLTLLTTRLAEIDEKPSPDALRLAARLQHRRDPPDAASTDRGSSRDDRRGNAAAS